MSCACRCHVYGAGTLVTCDVDTGSSGVPGIPSCSPCAGASPVARAGVAVPVATGVPVPAGTAVAAAERLVAARTAPGGTPVPGCVLPHALAAAEGSEGAAGPDGAEAVAPPRHVGLLCARHYGEIDGRLREIETLFALRDEVIVPGPGSDVRVSGGGFGSPAPGRIALMQVTDARMAASMGQVDVPGVLAAWVARLFAERGWLPPAAPPPRVPRIAGPVCGWRCGHASCVVARNAWRRPYAAVPPWTWRDGAWRLPEGVSWLAGKLRAERRWIACQEDWLPDYADELAAVHRVLAAATGSSMWPQPVGRCSNCQSTLYNPADGADNVTCRKCKTSWSGVHYLRLRLIFEQENAKAKEKGKAE